MKDFIELIERIFGQLPSLHIPSWILVAVVLLIAGGLAVAAMSWALSRFLEMWKAVQELIPRLSAAERRRALHRLRFTEHVQSELQRLDNLESWQDYRFTELEAEVEAEGSGRSLLAALQSSTGDGLRREKSLSRALQRSKERLVLVEGEPGSGKSVALRHVARKLARRAAFFKGPDSVVPLYINLKELDIPPDAVNHESMEAFVLRYINRVNRHDVEEFLDQEFRTGIARGSWFFLFDSFDEIPAVLSAIDPGHVVQRYAEALENFLSGMNRCRGVVATRLFRGPQTLSWPRFRILRLSDGRQARLIRNADLDPSLLNEFLTAIHASSSDIRAMSSNPMFLGLLCEHLRATRKFPQHSHTVFDSYFSRRLSREQGRIHRRFNLTPEQLMATAKAVAFAMTASTAIGLSPTRSQLHAALKELHVSVQADFDERLDALEYLKLARSETEAAYGSQRPFTFAHRRFQEYFATLYVLQDVRSVPGEILLSDGRWRETAVVLLQTQNRNAAADLLSAIAVKLRAASLSSNAHVQEDTAFRDARTLHVLGILQVGFSGRANELGDELRELALGAIRVIAHRGSLADRKDALEHAGAVPGKSLEEMMNGAFESGSRWLQETAFQQLARLVDLTSPMRVHVLSLLQWLFITGRLRHERYVVQAQLRRVSDNSLSQVFRLLLLLPVLDSLGHLAALIAVWAFSTRFGAEPPILFMIPCAIILAISRGLLQIGLGASTIFAARVVLAYFFSFSVMFVMGFSDHFSFLTTCAPILIGTLAVLWVPATVLGIRHFPRHPGAFTWLAVPILPVVHGFAEIRRNAPFVLLGLAVAGAFGWGYPRLERYFPALERLGEAMVGLVIAILALRYVIRTSIGVFRYARTMRIIHAVTGSLSCAQLNAALERCPTYKSKALLIRHVRQHGAATADHETLEYVWRLCRRLDTEVTMSATSLTNAGARWSTIMKDFAAIRPERTELLDFRDEVFRLNEQLLLQSTSMPSTGQPAPALRPGTTGDLALKL